jgi:hypothetical protein
MAASRQANSRNGFAIAVRKIGEEAERVGSRRERVRTMDLERRGNIGERKVALTA